MATEITETTELNVQLVSADGEATRIIKISNPDTETYQTKAEVETALAPLFYAGDTGTGTAAAYFFYDDGNQGGYEKPMTHVGDVEMVMTRKEVTKFS